MYQLSTVTSKFSLKAYTHIYSIEKNLKCTYPLTYNTTISMEYNTHITYLRAFILSPSNYSLKSLVS